VTEQNRVDNARGEALLGDDALRAAQALLALGLFNDAVSRAYYAAFHHARALLLLDGLEPKTHRGVVTLLSQHWAASGRLSQESLSDFAALQTFRAVADYDARQRLAQAQAEAQVAAAQRFVAAARLIVSDRVP
jgi:uncharacterized protein